jgi:hypothetical protein
MKTHLNEEHNSKENEEDESDRLQLNPLTLNFFSSSAIQSQNKLECLYGHLFWRHDTQRNDTQNNDTRLSNNNSRLDIMTLRTVMLSVI